MSKKTSNGCFWGVHKIGEKFFAKGKSKHISSKGGNTNPYFWILCQMVREKVSLPMVLVRVIE